MQHQYLQQLLVRPSRHRPLHRTPDPTRLHQVAKPHVSHAEVDVHLPAHEVHEVGRLDEGDAAFLEGFTRPRAWGLAGEDGQDVAELSIACVGVGARLLDEVSAEEAEGSLVAVTGRASHFGERRRDDAHAFPPKTDKHRLIAWALWPQHVDAIPLHEVLSVCDLSVRELRVGRHGEVHPLHRVALHRVLCHNRPADHPSIQHTHRQTERPHTHECPSSITAMGRPHRDPAPIDVCGRTRKEKSRRSSVAVIECPQGNRTFDRPRALAHPPHYSPNRTETQPGHRQPLQRNE
mmetsp:Transcript_44494/g.125843  ORF Transcript_44494/g.125843 Transcript_44494/m.125843 type:complete len:292 (-) Transcript_44494:138-1013(-)